MLRKGHRGYAWGRRPGIARHVDRPQTPRVTGRGARSIRSPMARESDAWNCAALRRTRGRSRGDPAAGAAHYEAEPTGAAPRRATRSIAAPPCRPHDAAREADRSRRRRGDGSRADPGGRVRHGRSAAASRTSGRSRRVAIAKPFWMGACEVSNEQFRRFDPGHDSRHYVKRHGRDDDQGLPLDGPRQPAVRVSWSRRWISAAALGENRSPLPPPDRGGVGVGVPRRRNDAARLWGTRCDSRLWANVADRAFTAGMRRMAGR